MTHVNLRSNGYYPPVYPITLVPPWEALEIPAGWKMKYIGRSATIVPERACTAIETEPDPIGLSRLLILIVLRVCAATTICSWKTKLWDPWVKSVTATVSLLPVGFCRVRNSENAPPV